MSLNVSKFIILTLSTTLLLGCSSKPSENAAKEVLKAKVSKQSKGLIQLSSFRKTNAKERNLLGTEAYEVEYEAEIQFLDDCWWGSPMGGGFETIKGNPGTFNFYMFQGKKKAHKGDKVTTKGSVAFEKTEKGWRGEDGAIY